MFTELLAKTRWLAVLLIGLWAGSLYLELSDDVDAGLRHVLYIGVLFQGALWVSGIVNYLLQRYRNAQVEEDPGLATALGAVGFIARTGVWATFLLMALANLGMDITALVTSLGIGGVAIALALQNVLGDLFASLSIVFDKPFQVGDFIQVGEFRGTVEHVGLKTTRIRALEGEQLVFGNSDLLGSRIRNYKRRVERRCAFTIGLTYDTPPDKVARVPDMIREIVESHEVARFDRSHFLTFGDFSLNVETVYYLKDPDYMVYADCQQAINLELMRRFAEEGIEFAFPTQTIMLQRVDPATG
ncbi:MAG: mechanosensitive ion channel family protein [Gemmatimonadetes bacterium]|nr:MAG: mechanosensitive ion channel family protein [Gemmatimonadota bacterium]